MECGARVRGVRGGGTAPWRPGQARARGGAGGVRSVALSATRCRRSAGRGIVCRRSEQPAMRSIAVPGRAAEVFLCAAAAWYGDCAVDSASIVVLGGSEPERAQLVAQLAGCGVTASAESYLPMADGLPALLIMIGNEAAQLVNEARDFPALAEIPILAVVPSIPPTAVAEALAAGATDVARQPVPPLVLAARCRNLCKLGKKDAVAAQTLARINEVLTADGDDAEALIHVLTITANVLGFDRAALVAHIEGSDHAFVVAASDAEPLQRFTLAIAEYPEVAEAIRTLSPVLIDDVLSHALTAPIAELLSTRRVRSIAVFPVQWRGRALGAILLRKRTPGVLHVGAKGVELGKLIASITAAHLRHGAVLESLRDQTHRISRARYEAERRLRGIDSLKEHFEAGADGVVVLDDAGRILFVNRAAERLTGFARDGLLGTELVDVVGVDRREQLAGTVSRVLAGVNVDAFDLQLSTPGGARVWVSVSTSTVLAGTGAVILALRDVTAERGLEHELRSTKEFLERLIDSAVDAIIAADLRGQVILFNQGAERLFGYRARDVIGKLPVWELYEPGGAKQIMRMLRSTSYGGVGRLEQTRREVRIASGEVVPVSMTASTLYERDREVATVGILTDLRERIRMEQRLLDAQQKLQLSEKQALVAELAGAAAHELNQPLTSIMGYAGLIERQSPSEAPYLRAVAVIVSEAERMAGIVKKIGKITKYETTDYVGTARMLDLERAAPESDPAISVTSTEEVTGEFRAVAPPASAVPALTPSIADLRELEERPRAMEPNGPAFGSERPRVMEPNGPAFGSERPRVMEPNGPAFGSERPRAMEPNGPAFGPERPRAMEPSAPAFGSERPRAMEPSAPAFGPERPRAMEPSAPAFGPEREDKA
ncbi:MAG: PAS domain S-box protein [Deltaproteobacteria bacterium]|nr:MAG: PAS domain S-box protein [Deltaproteobacteria bacterium]